MTTTKPPHMTSTARGTYSDDRGTPDWLVHRVKNAYGRRIGFDPATSLKHNDRLCARLFYTDAGEQLDYPYLNDDEMGWCNPPGPGKLVHAFWDRWIDWGWPAKAFLFFNVDHMRKATPPPRPTPVLLLGKRVKYVGCDGTAPTPSAVALAGIGSNIVQLRDLGHIFVWGTWPELS